MKSKLTTQANRETGQFDFGGKAKAQAAKDGDGESSKSGDMQMGGNNSDGASSAINSVIGESQVPGAIPANRSDGANPAAEQDAASDKSGEMVQGGDDDNSSVNSIPA